ncbi:fatty acid synthase-like [Pectinophora gossypiella]|uniref:fatty acid synthase-like n=1 Tax=Pectinophora gossypiella TaxID=13191 RepID=UPI00214E95E8|nr:fatty acid synthase-like [Pectinophora gossypiella]
MAPIPDLHSEQIHPEVQVDRGLDANAVVISGISAAMPNSHNMLEFADQLYDKKNFLHISSPRWKFKKPEVTNHHGIIPELDRFDAQFFMIFHKLSISMDPLTRKLLEHSYQAVFDAGICPTELSGKRVAVFVSTGVSEAETTAQSTDNHFGLLGCNKAMCANRISYYLNLRGPSVLVDCDSAGSAVALHRAYNSILNGECEAAIVGGVQLLQQPQTPLNYHKMVPVCADGNVKSYDMNADGHSLSEGVSVIYLQKHKDAKRVYASIRHIDCGFSEIGVYRDPEMLTNFFRKFYQDAKVSPSEVEYVEGFGNAVLDADKAELDAIDEVFCKDRTNTLAVGSVLSNVGYTHAVSALTAIVKLCLAYQRGSIAANINCSNPRMDVAGIAEGRLRILTEHAPFQRTFTAINNMSISGAHAHILLQGEYSPKNVSQYHTAMPHLVLASGRRESGVEKILNDFKSRPIDPEEVALVHSIFRMKITKHLARGYGVYSMNEENNETKVLAQKAEYYDERKRPLWFVYSGMGSQWAGMGTQLMRIPIFAAAIERCHKVLQPKGIDIVNVITSTDKTTFDNILNSFVGIAAVQIGLTDVLKAIGLVPDNIIGHSVGELGCAYADGCLTAEEMILMAYSRGLVSVQTPFIRGSMAAVGVGFKQISKMVPPEIEVACHNGPESSTISGPAEAMKTFVATLTEQNIFAKEVPCSNIAYHSRYIAEAGPALLSLLKSVVKEPKARSEKWMSTSIPQDNWEEPLAKYSSAEYHTNNLLSPVLFEETLRLVPSNAVLVEIAPHGLLQAILKRSLPESCRNIALTRRGHADNAFLVLDAIGNLYMEGYDMDVSALYPKINYPVSTETRPLAQLVEWVKDEKMQICHFLNLQGTKVAMYNTVISKYDEEHEYLSGNVVDGKRVFPFTGALIMAWDTLAMTLGQPRRLLSVKFRDVNFQTQPLLTDDRALHISTMLHRGNGRFEVSYEFGVIAAGFINVVEVAPEEPKDIVMDDDISTTVLTKDDVYKLLYERGYQYSNDFQSIESSNMSFSRAQLAWKNNWVTFLDGIVQLNILKREHKEISQIHHINSLYINIEEQKKYNDGSNIDVRTSEVFKIIKCGGVTVQHDILFKDKSSVLRNLASLKELKFVSFNETETVDVLTYLYVYIQIIVENLNKNVLNVLCINGSDKSCLLKEIESYLDSPPKIQLNIVSVSKDEILQVGEQQFDLIFLNDVTLDNKDMKALYDVAVSNTFMMKLNKHTETIFPTTFYRKVCSVVGKGNEHLELAKWKPSNVSPIKAAITIRNSSDLDHFKTTCEHLLGRKDKLLILTSYPAPKGLKEFVKEWNAKFNTYNIFLVMANKVVEEDIMNIPSVDLVLNILDNEGAWGGEYYVPLQDKETSGNTVALEITKFGNLNSLQWIDEPFIPKEGIPVKVQYAGLNIIDVKRAMNVLIDNQKSRRFGMDFSGVTERGERVMGVIKEGAICGKVHANPELLWPVPDHWSMEEAATVPLAYCLAFYILNIRYNGRVGTRISNNNVFIHGGAGALGQAVISICLANKLNVFTTVSDIHKKRFLLKIFPTLPAENIGSSRDISFKDMVTKRTQGENCLIVIMNNISSSDLRQATLNCTAALGVALDIASSTRQDNFEFGMNNLTNDRFYYTVDFSTIFNNMNVEEIKTLQLLVAGGIRQGFVRPLSRVTYSPQDMPRAFRLLAASRHRGRVLVDLRHSVPITHSRPEYSSDYSHLIFCDKSDLGVQLADRLVSNGVKKIYIHSFHTSTYLQFKIIGWQEIGVQVYVSYGNLKENDSIDKILNECNGLAPIEGIYIINIDATNARPADDLKNLVSHLDVATRQLCPSLRNFAIINENYLDREVCLNRVQDGFPVVSMELHNFEKFSDVSLNNRGDIDHNILRLPSALDGIEKALSSKKPIILTYAKPMEKNFLVDVERLLGVNLTDTNNDNTSLEQLGLDGGKAQELSNIIEEKYNVTISKEDYLLMTLAELKTLQEQLLNRKQDLKGLSSYINFVDDDELISSNEIVPKSTLVHTSDLCAVAFENELTYLCIVPGIEGHHRRFDTLCERLKLPALVLQPGIDMLDETIEEMAQRVVDGMLKRLILKDTFYLLGYEIGVLVALEMAMILEKRGLTGVVYCLGGGPEDICATMEAQFGNIALEELQNQLILHMYSTIVQSKSDELQTRIKELGDWEAKVDECILLIRNRSSRSIDYIRAVINSTYRRVLIARDYVWKQPKLSSKIVVIKAKSETESSSDSSLENVHQLDSTLPLVPEDLKCSAIVNKYLDAKILEDYYSQNLCESSKIETLDKVQFAETED